MLWFCKAEQVGFLAQAALTKKRPQAMRGRDDGRRLSTCGSQYMWLPDLILTCGYDALLRGAVCVECMHDTVG